MSQRPYSRRGENDGEHRRRPSRSRNGLALTALGAAFLVGLIVFSGSAGESPTAPSAAAKAIARQEAVRALRSVHGTWVPRAKHRFIDRSPEARLGYEPTLVEVLRDPDNPLFRSAVMLAVEQRNKLLLPHMHAALASADDAVQVFLVVEIDRLESWRDSELVEMLRGDSRGLVLAALRLIACRPTRPLQEIVPLLVHDDAEIRAAALEALPPALSSDLGDQILIAQEFVPMGMIGEALAALARCPPSPATEDVLYTHLEQRTRHVHLVLRAFQRRGLPLTRPDRVSALVRDSLVPVATRGRAIRCLEATKTPGAADVLEPLQFDHPVLEYLAARVLVQANRPSGVTRLLAVLGEDYDAVDEAEAAGLQEARIGSRQILALLAATSIYEDVSVWEKWAEGRQTVTIDRLPPVSVRLGVSGGS